MYIRIKFEYRFTLKWEVWMILEERRHLILDIVAEEGFISLQDLASRVGASESTVRRDIEALNESGHLRKTHGGAASRLSKSSNTPNGMNQLPEMPSFEENRMKQINQKSQIAALVAEMIEDGQSVMIDGGGTTFEIASRLIGRNIQIVTNSLPIAQLFAKEPATELILLGGYLYPRTQVALGSVAIDSLENAGKPSHPARDLA